MALLGRGQDLSYGILAETAALHLESRMVGDPVLARSVRPSLVFTPRF
ncbi:MAG: hypothetical protein KGL11_10145 [Alphaproteobacteria bacterium]|nr:hypothetical protein [Alphaproteobacteria bacterium]